MKRNRNKAIAIALGVGAAVLLFFRSRKDIFGLNYSIVGVSSLNVINGLSAIINVRIQNPGVTPFPMYNTTISGQVNVNNSLSLGTATGTMNETLAPGSAIIVPVSVVVNPAILTGGLPAVLQLLNGSGVLFSFVGKITIGGVSSPLNLSYKVL